MYAAGSARPRPCVAGCNGLSLFQLGTLRRRAVFTRLYTQRAKVGKLAKKAENGSKRRSPRSARAANRFAVGVLPAVMLENEWIARSRVTPFTPLRRERPFSELRIAPTHHRESPFAAAPKSP